MIRKISLTAVALVPLVGPLEDVAGPKPGDARLRADADAEVVITLLHTNDLHGSILFPDEPRGLARIATLARQMRAEMPHVLLLDGGDIIHGTPAEKVFEGQPAMAAMNAAGYDAAVAGNHEFDFGQRIARDAFRAADFPMLSANVVDAATRRPWGGLRPYVVRELGGVRVAIFGLTTDGTPEIQWPRTIEGIEFQDPIEVARTLVPRLRESEGAVVVVALTHLGVAADRQLAAAVPGIDVIVGGHSHTRLDQQVWVDGTLVVQAGSGARDLGRIDLRVRRGEDGSTVVAVNGQDGRWWGQDGELAPLGETYPPMPLIPLSASIPDDAAVVAAFQPFRDSIQAYLAQELTTAVEPLPATGAGAAEITLGNLQADAVRELTGADMGLSALYSLNPAGLPSGPVRTGDVYELFGGYTRQHLVVVRASGASIARMLVEANDDGVRLHISGGRFLDGVLHLGGFPVEPQRRYTVASAAHIIQDHLLERDGTEVLSDDPEAPTIRDATIEFLRGHPPLRDDVERRLRRRTELTRESRGFRGAPAPPGRSRKSKRSISRLRVHRT